MFQAACAKEPTALKASTSKQAVQLSYADKYPGLANAKNSFWEAWEEINKTNDFARLTVRAARNTFDNIINEPDLWRFMHLLAERYSTTTHDQKKAEKQVASNVLMTEFFVNPISMDIEGVPLMIEEFYETIFQLEYAPVKLGVDFMTTVIEKDMLFDALDLSQYFLEQIDNNSFKQLPDYLEKINMILDLGVRTAKVNDLTGGLVKNVMSYVIGGDKKKVFEAIKVPGVKKVPETNNVAPKRKVKNT